MTALANTSTHNIVEDNQVDHELVWYPVANTAINLAPYTHGGEISEANCAMMDSHISVDHAGHDVFGGLTVMPVSRYLKRIPSLIRRRRRHDAPNFQLVPGSRWDFSDFIC